MSGGEQARPLLLVDVDGPLNPYAAKPQHRPEGYETHRLLTPRWEAAERRRLAVWGMPHKRVKPLRVWLNPAHGRALARLPFELAWATTWEEEANNFVAPVLGLPVLPFVRWSSDARSERCGEPRVVRGLQVGRVSVRTQVPVAARA
jgi:hypothetical protein